MSIVLIGLGLLAGIGGLAAWVLVIRLRRQPRPDLPLTAGPPTTSTTATASPAPAHAAAAAAALRRAERVERDAMPTVPAEAPPAALANFHWAAPDSLSPQRQQALVAALRRIPRPAPALQQLMSPQFLARASSGELSDLVTGEVQIAVKVLAAVNSPFYGLRQPVSRIGQAVTFLGLNSVRSICMQYLLDDSFKAGNAEQRRACAQIWAASALASELCAKLAPRLALPDPGAMVAQVLLSFLGHLGATSLLLHQPGAQPTSVDLLTRCRRTQDELGLTPAEIGGLLLREWSLPETIIHEVCSIDRLLVTPAEASPSRRNQSLAVAYLCARLGERLAVAPTDLAGFDPRHATGDDFFHLRGYLASPGLARLNDHLHGPDVLRCLQALHPPQLAPVGA